MKWQTIITGTVTWYALRGINCVITLEPRPFYCDRGNWLAKLHPVGELARSIDQADLWPRYYFDRKAAFRECEAWLIKRYRWTDDSAAALPLEQVGISASEDCLVLDDVAVAP